MTWPDLTWLDIVSSSGSKKNKVLASGDIFNENYSNNYEEYEEDLLKSLEEEQNVELKVPEFVSTRVDLVVNEDETIRLPCLFERWAMIRCWRIVWTSNFRLEGFTLLWKKDDKIISLGNQIIDNVEIFSFSINEFTENFTAWLQIKLGPKGKWQLLNDWSGQAKWWRWSKWFVSELQIYHLGEYTCQVSASTPTQMLHTVKIRGI